MAKNPFLMTKNDILDALSSIWPNEENLQSSSILSSRNTNPSALDALQGYGPRSAVLSPTWNIDHNTEPSLTPSSVSSCKPFNNLNLNSIEEEDEFLYGDSNSNPSEQISAKKNSINNAGRLETGWSDEEDPYGETRKLHSRLKKKLSDCDSQNKIQESVKFPHIKEDIPERNAFSPELAPQKHVSPNPECGGSILLSAVENNEISEVNSTLIGNKSKYHAAAEALKKKAVEKTNSSSEKLGISPGTSKSGYEFDKSLHADPKIDKSDIKRINPRKINKKHLDNIKNYISGPQQKRVHPDEDLPPEKYARHEISRSFSPSSHSPHRSALPSYKHKYPIPSERDHIKHSASYSRYGSPSFESEKRHPRYPESHKRYSPSPKRWSRSPDYRRRRSCERNADYNRHKVRSPRSRRSRSKSPGYYSSRNKTYDKKKICKSPKKSKYYSKKKDKSSYSSGDSFCSLSLDSSESGSDSYEDSSDEKKKSKKPSKTVPKGNKKVEDKTSVSKKSDSTTPAADLSKKLSDMFNIKDLPPGFLDPDNIRNMLTAAQPNREQQLLMNFFGQLQQQPQQQPYEPTIDVDINIPSNMQMPIISTSNAYAYPSVPAAPVQYVAPQTTNFPSMISSAAFPAPVMTVPSPDQYGPYLPMPSVQPDNSQYVTNIAPKSANIRPSTLRSIPVSDNFHVSNSSSNTTVVPDVFSMQMSTTIPKTQESRPSQKFNKQSSEKKTNLKEKEAQKNVSSSSKVISEKVVESNSEQNKILMIEKFKRMKADRAKAFNKSKSASEDLEEMHKVLDETFGKRISESEKMLYSKCKNQFNLALDTANQKNKEARRADEILNNFKAKLPTPVLTEVSKIKLEDCIEEPVTNEIVSCLDQGDHLCCDCYIHFEKIKDVLDHIQTPEHKEHMNASSQDWKKDFIKEQKVEDSKKKVTLKFVRGAEFIKPLTGFYCSLCKEVLLDKGSVEQHLKGHQHYTTYDNFAKGTPLYERKRLFHFYIKRAIADKQKKIKAAKEKQQQLAEEMKMRAEQKKQMLEQRKTHVKTKEEILREKTMHQAEVKKIQEAAEKKSKEILLREKSKEIQTIELDAEESEDSIPSSSQKIANIKLNLSDKDKLVEKKNSSKEVENKNSPKFNFAIIGKAPNYKKPQIQKPTPWYKRENILNKKESNNDISPFNVFEKSTKKNQSPEPSSEDNLSSDTTPCHDDKVFKNKDLAVKEVERGKLDSSDSYNVKLSDIRLPEVSSLPSSNNANTPQPMDIDNSQDVQDKPKSEEEKDFHLLGINREDFKPLVVPVPPPHTSMVSYPIMSNAQTVSSNISSSTTSTSVEQFKTLDFSVPPPTITPYQNNAPCMSVYGNQNNIQSVQNNTQNVGAYPYPTHPQMPVYSSQTQMQAGYQTMPPFSTPPPVFRNPPPILPYSNTSNMQPHASQFSNTSNLSYNTYSNSANLNNQLYQPPAYSVPPNNQTNFPVANTSQNIVPPGSEYDTSFHNNKNYNAVTSAPVYVQQSKPSLTTVGNLILIAPEKHPNQVSTPNPQITYYKPPKLVQVASNFNVQDKSKVPVVEYVNKIIKKKVEKNKTKTINSVNVNKVEISKVLKNNEENSCTSSNISDEKLDIQCRESKIKHIDKCVKEAELEHCNVKENVESSSTVEDPAIENESNSDEKSKKMCESTEVGKSSKSICSLSGNLKETDEVTRSGKDNQGMHETKAIFDQSTENVTNDSAILNHEQINANDANEFQFDKTSKANSKKDWDKLIDIDNNIVSEKYSTDCYSFAENSNNKIGKKNDVEIISLSTVVEEKCMNDSHINEVDNKPLRNTNLAPISVNATADSNQSEVSNNDNDKENNQSYFGELIPEKTLEFEIGIVEKSPKNICSSSGTLDKIDEVAEAEKNQEITIAIEADEKIIDDIHESKAVVDENIKNVTNDSAVLNFEQMDTNELNEILFDEAAETNTEKDCDKIVDTINIGIVEKSPKNICSLSGTLDKIDEVAEAEKNQEITIAIEADEKIIDDIHESKTVVDKSIKNVTNDSAVLNFEQMDTNELNEILFDETSETNTEKDCDKIVDTINIVSEKSSIDNYFFAENSGDKIYDKCDVEMTDVSLMIKEKNMSDSCSNEVMENIHITPLLISDNVDSSRHEMCTKDIENKNNQSNFEEISLKLHEELIPEKTVKAEDVVVEEESSNRIYLLSGMSVKNDDEAEDRMNTEIAVTDKDNAEINETDMHDRKTVMEKSTENVTESSYKTSNENDKICYKFIEGNDNVASGKSTENCFVSKNSNKINEKNEIVEMSHVNTAVKNENVNDSCNYKMMQDEISKSCVVSSFSEENITEEKKYVIQNTDMLSMLMNDNVDTNQKDSNTIEAPVDKSAKKRGLDRRMTRQEKARQATLSDNPSLISSKVAEKETDIQEVEFVSSNPDANEESNQISARKKGINRRMTKQEKSREASFDSSSLMSIEVAETDDVKEIECLSSNLDADEENNLISTKKKGINKRKIGQEKSRQKKIRQVTFYDNSSLTSIVTENETDDVEEVESVEQQSLNRRITRQKKDTLEVNSLATPSMITGNDDVEVVQLDSSDADEVSNQSKEGLSRRITRQEKTKQKKVQQSTFEDHSKATEFTDIQEVESVYLSPDADDENNQISIRKKMNKQEKGRQKKIQQSTFEEDLKMTESVDIQEVESVSSNPDADENNQISTRKRMNKQDKGRQKKIRQSTFEGDLKVSESVDIEEIESVSSNPDADENNQISTRKRMTRQEKGRQKKIQQSTFEDDLKATESADIEEVESVSSNPDADENNQISTGKRMTRQEKGRQKKIQQSTFEDDLKVTESADIEEVESVSSNPDADENNQISTGKRMTRQEKGRQKKIQQSTFEDDLKVTESADIEEVESVSSNPDAHEESNQLSTRKRMTRQEKNRQKIRQARFDNNSSLAAKFNEKEINDVQEVESVSSNPDADEESNQTPARKRRAIQKKDERDVKSSQMEDLDHSEMSTSVLQGENKAEDKLQATDLKVDKNEEDSRILEDMKEKLLHSDYQVSENKMKASDEYATEVKEDALESAVKSSDLKDSSDTEDYEDGEGK